MIAADIEPRALLTPKLEIVSVDPNYMEYDDWDECSCTTTPSISSSSGFKSHENDSEDLFEEDMLHQPHNRSSSKDISIVSDQSYEKNPEIKSIFPEDSKKFQTNCYRIDAYANVVNWLDSTSALPLFPKPIKIKGQTDFPIEMLDHKRIELGNPQIKHESPKVDSDKAVVVVVAHKKSQLSEKCNAENLIDHQMTNVEKLTSKHADKSCGPANNILFEKNHIETTNRIKNAPIPTKKKLNLEEYLKRRPDLKLNPSKGSEIKKETNDWNVDANQTKCEQEGSNNTIQDLYEEIIVVSIGSNTDVTIPFNDSLTGDVQSIKLISKITDTIAKVTNDGGEHIIHSSNSLIASIRDVIIKKSSLNCSTNVADSTTNETPKEVEHGEDKTIMHLKKDRVRYTYTSVGVGIQTDCDIRFPPLEKTKSTSYAKSLCRSPSTSSRSSYSSYSSDNRKRKCSNSPIRRSMSRNNFSSWPKQGFEKSYKRSRQENDERCTVYVGRIETTTSKDDLKAKFEKYGAIKEVSTHQKKNGMKFGFVTFKSAKDAYNTIDGSASDPALNAYDISFGGRRAFCKESYLDLDNTNVYQQEYQQGYVLAANGAGAEPQNDSFEDLLRKVKLEIESSQKHIK